MADYSQLDLMMEAAKRGILPADQMALLQEAQKRGLVPGGDNSSNDSGDIQQEMTTTPANAGKVGSNSLPTNDQIAGMSQDQITPILNQLGNQGKLTKDQAKTYMLLSKRLKDVTGNNDIPSTDYKVKPGDFVLNGPANQAAPSGNPQNTVPQAINNQQPQGQPDKSDLGATVNGLFQGFANFLGNQGDAARIEMGQSGDNPDELTQGANQTFKQGGLITNTQPASELGVIGNIFGNMVGGSAIPDLVTGGIAGAPGMLRNMLMNNALQTGASYGAEKLFPGSAGAQIAAGMLVPGARMAPSMAKRLLTGDPAQYAANLQAFQNAGMNPHIGQVGSGFSKALTSILSKFPGSYGQFYKLAQAQNEAAQANVLGAANQLGDAITPNGAGNALQRDINGTKNTDGTFVNAMKNRWDQLNSKFFSYMKPKDSMSLANTMNILNELSKPIDGLEETSQLLRNNLIKSLNDKLRIDTSPNTAEVEPQGFTDPIPPQTQTTFEPVNGVTHEEVTTPIPGTEVPAKRIPGRMVLGKDMVDGANLPETTVEAADALRRMIGKKLGDTSILNKEEQGIYASVYKALSDDFRVKANNVGPGALKAWNNQNNFWEAARNRLNTLEPIGDNASPGRAWQSIFSDSKLDPKKMWQVRRSVTPETWKDQVSTWLTQAGQPAGKQGAEWNLNTFLQNYEKLSPESKTALFGGQGMNGLDKEMENLYQAGKRIRDTAKYGANPTGSGQAAVQGGIVASALTSALTGHFKTAGAMMATGPIGAGIGKLLTSPWFVKRLANATKLPVSQIPGYMARVSAAMQMQSPGNTNQTNQAPAALDWSGFDKMMKDNQQNDPVNIQGSNDLKPSVVELSPVVHAAAASQNLNPKWVSALVNNEAVKRNGHYVTSSKGAVGPMQILPSTASDYGVTPDKLADPETNIKVGTEHYSHLLKVFGDPVVAAMAYNAGEGEVKYLMHKYNDNWEAHLPKQTRIYADNFRKQIS